MSITKNFYKKILAVMIAAIVIIALSPEVFAENLELNEVSEENIESEERLKVSVDYSELERQIALASGLNKRDYTFTTWDELEKAIADGLETLNNEASQQEVNEAIKTIETAVLNLVKLDYSVLELALAEASEIIDNNKVQYDFWLRMNSAVEEGKIALISGNQEKMDQVAEELDALLKEFAEKGTIVPESSVIVNTKEVEVPPSDDFCNIPMHKVWPILFALSAVLNVTLIAGTAYIFMKKRHTEDDIPLVDYDIDDDMEDFSVFEDEETEDQDE